jgi:thymidylate kinase
METQTKVREVYLKYVAKGELVRIDGDQPKETVAEEMYSKVSGLLKAAEGFVF